MNEKKEISPRSTQEILSHLLNSALKVIDGGNKPARVALSLLIRADILDLAAREKQPNENDTDPVALFTKGKMSLDEAIRKLLE